MTWRAFRKALQFAHLWAGLIVGIPLVLIGITGTAIVAINAIRDYAPPAAPARGLVQPMSIILDVARTATPPDWSLTMITVPARVGRPAAVQVTPPPRRDDPRPNFQGLTIYIDPVALNILGIAERRRAGEFSRAAHNMHVALMAPAYYGLQTVGFLGLFMVLFGLSGLVLWWPRKGQWRFAFGIKRGATGFRWNRDLHGALGIWSLLVFLILSVSGVMLSFPVSFQAAVGTVLPLETALPRATVDPAIAAEIADRDALTPDEAARVAKAAVPNSRLREVQLPPDAKGGVYMVTLAPEPFDDGAPEISVFVGPGPEILDVVDPRQFASGKQLQQWLRVLHYGRGIGEGWRWLVFFAGLSPLLFTITGMRMWWLKRKQRRRVPAGIPQPAE